MSRRFHGMKAETDDLAAPFLFKSQRTHLAVQIATIKPEYLSRRAENRRRSLQRRVVWLIPGEGRRRRNTITESIKRPVNSLVTGSASLTRSSGFLPALPSLPEQAL